MQQNKYIRLNNSCPFLVGGAVTDFHHNIFYYYRGSQQSDQDRERQFENNTTKALINTLEYCNPKVVIKFLAWLGITATEPIKFELQKVTIGEGKIHTKPQRLLLGLVPRKEDTTLCFELKGPVKGDSCPDAWLYGNDYIVLLESKVSGSLETNQMQFHYQKLKVDTEKQPRFEVRTWAEVHQFFIDFLPELSAKDEWIVRQFTKYLEWNAMTEFIGFEQGIFDYFVTDDDEDSRRWVRDTMHSFAKKIKTRLQAFNSFYQDYDMGTIRLEDTYCWVAFGPGDLRYRQWVHQTISLDAYALEVFVNVELKPTIDRLRKKIHQNKQAFREIISKLPEPFSLQVEERTQKQASLYDYYTIANLDSYCLKNPDSELSKHGYDYIEVLLEKVSLPYLSVRRRLDRDLVLEISQKDRGQSFVDMVVSIMQKFHPLVGFINQPEYSKLKK